MALLSSVSDTWVSEDQFESEAFSLERSLQLDEHVKFVDGWLRIHHQLNQLASLEDDWDGAGASPVNEAIIESVRNWFESLRHNELKAPTRIVADPDGAIVVEWLDAGIYFEVEISEPYKGEWMSRHGDEEAQYGEIDLPSQFTFTDDTISGAESRPMQGGIGDTTWSSSEHLDVYAASA